MSNPVIIEQEIKMATDRYSFGIENPVKADTAAWADQVERIGADAKWAIEWIIRGYPNPPEWVKRVPSGAGEMWKLDPDREVR